MLFEEPDPEETTRRRVKKINPCLYTHDFTTPWTRQFNRQPRIFADPPCFNEVKKKTTNALFEESQERVQKHIESIIQYQKDTFEDSLRDIDEMSQENEDRLEKIEKGLQRLKKMMLQKHPKNKEKQTKPNTKKKSNQKSDRASLMMKQNKQNF